MGIINDLLDQLTITASSGPITPISSAKEVHSPQLSFDELWVAFIESLAESMDLFHDCMSDTLWVGNGMRDMACILSSPLPIGNDTQPRQVLWALQTLLASPFESLQQDAPLICSLVGVLRAVLYLYGGNSAEEREAYWEQYVCGAGIAECRELHEIQWSQWMLSGASELRYGWLAQHCVVTELGAPQVLAALAGSPEIDVKMNNIAFGTALLEGGNKQVQDLPSGCIAEYRLSVV